MSKRPRFHLFNIHHSTKHIPGPFAHNMLELGQTTSILPRVAQNYRTRDRSTLWISVMGNTSLVKRVVRSKVTRKLRSAFTAALEQAGYSPEGRSLNPSGSNLMGSITFVNLQFLPLLRQQSELEAEMTSLVQMLVKTQQQETRDAVKREARADDGTSIATGATKALAGTTTSPKEKTNRSGRMIATDSSRTRSEQISPSRKATSRGKV